jgi:Protein of unknown function (DUF1242)
MLSFISYAFCEELHGCLLPNMEKVLQGYFKTLVKFFFGVIGERTHDMQLAVNASPGNSEFIRLLPINLSFHNVPQSRQVRMSALFNFQSLLLVILLMICTCTYLHAQIPAVMDRNKNGYARCLVLLM